MVTPNGDGEHGFGVNHNRIKPLDLEAEPKS